MTHVAVRCLSSVDRMPRPNAMPEKNALNYYTHYHAVCIERVVRSSATKNAVVLPTAKHYDKWALTTTADTKKRRV